MGLYGNPPPPGFRVLTHVDLMDAILRSRLVAEHQARGGWGLCHPPLQFLGRLTVAEGHFLVNGDTIGMVGQGKGVTTASGVYVAATGNRKVHVPWTTAPPVPDATWAVVLLTPRPSQPCLFIRVVSS